MPFVEHLMGLGTPGGPAGAMAGTGATGITATGTTAADAFQLSTSWASVGTSSASTGVKAPNVTQGFGGVLNLSGQTIVFYPPSTSVTINAAASSVTIANGKTFIYFWTSPTTMAGGALA